MYIINVVNGLKIPVYHLSTIACLTIANENRVFLSFSDWGNWLKFPVKRLFPRTIASSSNVSHGQKGLAVCIFENSSALLILPIDVKRLFNISARS